jgi:hypothetical protein
MSRQQASRLSVRRPKNSNQETTTTKVPISCSLRNIT